MSIINKEQILTKAEKLLSESRDLFNIAVEISFSKAKQSLKLFKLIGDIEKAIHCYIIMGDVYRASNKTAALKYYNLGLKENNGCVHPQLEINLLNNLGNTYFIQGKFEFAHKYYQQAITVCKKYHCGNTLLSALIVNTGNCLQVAGKLTDSLKLYLAAYKIKAELNDKTSLGNILNNIGMLYQAQDKHRAALKYFHKSLLIRSQMIDTNKIAASYSNMACSYKSLTQLDEAEKYFKLSLELREENNNRCNEFLGLGQIYMDREDFDSAEAYLIKAVELAKDDNRENGLQRTYNALGSLSLKKDNLQDATKYLYESLILATNSGYLQGEISTCLDLAEYYEKISDFANALKYFKRYDELRFKLFNENTDRQIEKMQHKFESDKKKKEITLAKSKAELLRLKTVELEKDKAEAELISLQSRINPHFLFNSLNTIISLVRTAPEDAEIVTENLSELLRYTLLVAKRKLVSLSEEFELIGQYLLIEKVRFGNRLNYQIDLPKELSAVKIPPLLLQPLAENAIKYSIAPALNGGTLKISAKSVNDFIELTISNTISDQNANGKINPGTGFGLEYVKQRLELAYKKKNLLKVRCKDLFEVIIKIPKIE